MHLKCFILFRKTLFVPVIQLRYNKYNKGRMEEMIWQIRKKKSRKYMPEILLQQ